MSSDCSEFLVFKQLKRATAIRCLSGKGDSLGGYGSLYVFPTGLVVLLLLVVVLVSAYVYISSLCIDAARFIHSGF
jgi:hypothetical protein